MGCSENAGLSGNSWRPVWFWRPVLAFLASGSVRVGCLASVIPGNLRSAGRFALSPPGRAGKTCSLGPDWGWRVRHDRRVRERWRVGVVTDGGVRGRVFRVRGRAGVQGGVEGWGTRGGSRGGCAWFGALGVNGEGLGKGGGVGGYVAY